MVTSNRKRSSTSLQKGTLIKMSAEELSPKREATPSASTPISSIPQKRALEDDHQPTVSSPLNPDFKPKTEAEAPLARERASRAKKESLKKRESKAGSLAPESNGRSTPDPKPNKSKKEENGPIRYKLAPPRPSDFDPPRGPIFIPSHQKVAPDGSVIQFNETTEHVLNKKAFHYTHCIADPAFPSSLYYRQSETEPFGPRLNFEDKSTHMFLDESGRHITTTKGFRMVKANVGVREGRWFWECKITSGIPRRKRNESHASNASHGHVRMGWARKEATLDAPVGFDAYSYGLRDVDGQKMFMSRPKDFFPKGEDIKEGDVIGLEINLPSMSLHKKVVDGSYNPAADFIDEGNLGIERADIIRDRVPIRYKTHLYFEKIEYHPVKELEELMNPSPLTSTSSGLNGSGQDPSPTHPVPALRTLPHSSIKIYKNGQLIGTAFENLLAFLPPASKPLEGQVGARDGLDDGMLGYYPAVSVFREGAAEVNFGPNFWYPPPDYDGLHEDVNMHGSGQSATSDLQKLRAIGERYDEQIVEDIVYDIIDEVDFWIQDGCVTGKGATNGIRSAGVSTQNGLMAAGEIKEIVQDDE